MARRFKRKGSKGKVQKEKFKKKGSKGKGGVVGERTLRVRRSAPSGASLDATHLKGRLNRRFPTRVPTVNTQRNPHHSN
jgi:hypothetical protein